MTNPRFQDCSRGGGVNFQSHKKLPPSVMVKLLEETFLTCNIKLQHFMSALFLHPVCTIIVLRSSVSFCRHLMVSLLQQWSLCGFLKSNSLKWYRPCLQYPKFITMIRVTLDKNTQFF